MRYPKRIRLDPEMYSNAETVFHVIVRAHPETDAWSNDVRNAIWRVLFEEAAKSEVTLHAAVLMPDHLHLVVQPAALNLISWVGALKSRTARAVWAFGVRRTPWQPRFYDRGLRSAEEYEVVMAYVLRNPSAAGLVEDDDLWPWRWVRPG